MPTYEYECDKCGHRFERFQGISEGPIRECPRCEGTVRRLISTGAAIIVKGGGRARAAGCSLENTGETCCGRSQRCDDAPCHNGS